MKTQHTLIFVLILLFGCDVTSRDIVPRRYADFDTAIEVIATSGDIDDANAAAAQLYSGGVPAINALRKHLDDKRAIPSGFCSRALNTYEGLTIADQALWTIQEMIEPDVAKAYGHSNFLEKGNVEQWLDERKGMSIIELRAEAARTDESTSGNNRLGR